MYYKYIWKFAQDMIQFQNDNYWSFDILGVELRLCKPFDKHEDISIILEGISEKAQNRFDLGCFKNTTRETENWFL